MVFEIKPDEDITVEEGQVYEDSRTGGLFELVYVDGNIYVSQDSDGNHRLGKRVDFEVNVSEERYKLRPEKDSFAETNMQDGGEQRVAFEDLDNIGEKGADNLREAGIETHADVKRASDEEILDVPWVGDGGLVSIRREIG